MQIQQELTQAIANAYKQAFERELDTTRLQITRPANLSWGDFSTNVVMMESAQLGMNPREAAQKLVEQILLTKPAYITEVGIAGPGFINFRIDPLFYKQFVSQYHSHYFHMATMAGQKVAVEFADPNPFKEFHIGHLYNATLGESIARLYETQGAEVYRFSYQGDVGLHVAKSLRGIQLKLEEMGLDMSELQTKLGTVSERAAFLGQAYSLGANLYEEDEQEKIKIREINKAVYAKDESIMEMYNVGKAWSLEYFDQIFKLVGIGRGKAYDFYYFESEVAQMGVDIVMQNLEKGIFERSEGAVIFPGEKYGLHNRVFINSDGLPTYEAKELALAPRKFAEIPYDLSIIITGNEINDYFKVLLKALELISPDLASKTKHFGTGMVRMPEGKISSRKGNVFTGDKLIEMASEEPLKKLKSSDKIAKGADLEKLAAKIGLAAIKYAYTKVSIGKDVEFDLDEALSIQGKTGPFIQYAYTRANSILQSAPDQSIDDLNLGEILNAPEELSLMRLVYDFPQIVADAAKTYSPHLVANFAFELAQAFNVFYTNCQVLNAESVEIKKSRIYLVKVTAEVIAAALDLLGIETVDRM